MLHDQIKVSEIGQRGLQRHFSLAAVPCESPRPPLGSDLGKSKPQSKYCRPARCSSRAPGSLWPQALVTLPFISISIKAAEAMLHERQLPPSELGTHLSVTAQGSSASGLRLSSLELKEATDKPVLCVPSSCSRVPGCPHGSSSRLGYIHRTLH